MAIKSISILINMDCVLHHFLHNVYFLKMDVVHILHCQIFCVVTKLEKKTLIFSE